MAHRLPDSDSDKDKNAQPDLLFRMSKKIAQLTKVVHALNTKLDANEIIIGLMRDSHEEALNQLRAEAKKKLSHFQKLGRADSVLKQRVEELEKKLEDSEKRAQDFAQAAAECQTKLEISESTTTRLKNEWQQEREKGNIIVSEMQSMNEQRFADAERNLNIRIQQLQVQCQEKDDCIDKTFQDSQIKCQSIRDDFESQLFRSERACENLRETVAQLQHQRKVFETEFHQEISRLAQRSQLQRERNDELETKICHLNNGLDEARKEIQEWNIYMTELTSKFQSSLEELQSERQDAQQLREERAMNEKNMNQYADLLTELRLCNAKQQEAVKHLQSQVEELEEKLKVEENLIQETRNMMDEKLTENDKVLAALQKAYDELSLEKKLMGEKLEKEIVFLNKCSSEQQQQLNDDYEWKLREIERDYKNRAEIEKKKHEERITSFLEDQGTLTVEKDKLRSELAALQAEMKSKLYNAEAELSQLRGLTNELQKGAKVASTQLDQMRNVEIRLREEHSDTRFQLRESRKTITKLQADIEELKLVQERELRVQEIRLAAKLTEETRKINGMWAEKLRLENETFKEKIDCQYREEKMSALVELRQQMNDELDSEKAKHKQEIDEFSLQIDTLKQDLMLKVQNYESELDRLNDQHENILQNLNRQLEEKERDYQRKKADDKSKEQLVEDLQMQLSAHRGTVELVRTDAENRKQNEIDSLNKTHQGVIDTVMKECEEKIAKHQDLRAQNHKTQLRTARIELEKFMELSSLKEKERQQCIEELRGEINLRDGIIHRLNNEVDRLKSSLLKISQDMEFRARNKHGKGKKDCTNIIKEPREQDLIAIRQLRQALLNKDQLARKLQEEKKLLQLQLFHKVASMARLSTSLPVVDKIDNVTKRRHKPTEPKTKRFSAPSLERKTNSPILRSSSEERLNNQMLATTSRSDS